MVRRHEYPTDNKYKRRECRFFNDIDNSCDKGATVIRKELVRNDEYEIAVYDIFHGDECPVFGEPSVQYAAFGDLPKGETSMCDSFIPKVIPDWLE